jgi:hypothetical protein
MITTPSTSSEAITLAAVGNRVLAAAGQSDMVWGHASVRDAFAALDVPIRPLNHAGSLFSYPEAAVPLRRWGQEEDTVAKRAVVWSDSQLLAGFEYLARAAGPS